MLPIEGPVILLHGWSGSSKSLTPLAEWLRQQGVKAKEIHLGDYLSMNDEVTVEDLGFAFRRALDREGVSQAPQSFNLVVHSTGGLVAREYLRQVCQSDPARSPIQHLCMLAPANFGSPWATIGKSYLGRITAGWGWNHLFQTGQKILDALEFAAPYTWQLAEDDLFNSRFPVFSPKYTMTTVLVGTVGYTGLKSVTHEDGTDGTVRVATANLNAHSFVLDFSQPDKPTFVERDRNGDRIAFAVFSRSHASILQPVDGAGERPGEYLERVVAALSATTAQYKAHVAACDAISERTFSSGLQGPDEADYHRYMHVVFRVRDQFDKPVDDYFVEFYQEKNDSKDHVFQKIHGEILEKVTKNTRQAHYRSFFFDTTDLHAYLRSKPDTEVRMSLNAAALSKNIGYRNPPNMPSAGIPVFTARNARFIFPNEPVLVDVRLYRDPADGVFVLRPLA